MPKQAPFVVRWVPEVRTYEVRATGNTQDAAGPIPRGLTLEDDAWRSWLDGVASFAFHSRTGDRCTVRRETVRRGAYWYAYRSLGGRTVKRYVGRTADLSISRLEEVAVALAATSEDDRAAKGNNAAAASGDVSIDGAMEGANPALPVLIAAVERRLEMPLLTSKIHPPRLSGALVARPRLLDRLDEGLSRRLTLIVAPAGFGKTTLARQWIAALGDGVGEEGAPSVPAAWVSLDADDNDPVRFWRYVVTACLRIDADAGEAMLERLSAGWQPPFDPPPLEATLGVFLNDIARRLGGEETPGKPNAPGGLLVLEDYHVVAAPRIHETLAFFIDHLPPSLHLVMLTRGDPPLPLARWRARGDLHEVRAADLRFSAEETDAFFQQALPFSLNGKTIKQLDARLEGWAAGVRLLSLAVQSASTPAEAEGRLAALDIGGDADQPHPPILDYFASEVLVLQAQPGPLHLFLLQTSVLGRLNGSLCDAVTDRRDSATLLVELARAGLFLEMLDESDEAGAWYRYHALFAEALRAIARRRLGDEALRELSLRASRWYEGHGLTDEAIVAALRAGDHERSCALIERLAREWEGRFTGLHTLRRWIERLPEAARRAHPGLCLIYARTLLFSQYPDLVTPVLIARIDAELRAADDGWESKSDLAGRGEVWAFRAMIAWREGRLEQAARDARQSLVWLPNDDAAPGAFTRRGIWDWRGVNTAILGAEALEQGRIEDARQLLREARRRSSSAENRPFARITTLLLGRAYEAAGDLRQAEAYYRQVLPDAREQDDREDVANALLGLTDLSYEWNDLAATGRLLDEVQAIGALPDVPDIGEALAFRQALLNHACGRTPEALRLIAAVLVRLEASTSQRPMETIPTILAWQGRLHLAIGDLFAAQQSLDALDRLAEDSSPVQREAGQILAARVLLARGEAADALSLLDPLLVTAHERGHGRQALEVGMVTVLALAACRRGREARERLREVLTRASGQDFMRLFLDEGEPLAVLLRSLPPTSQEPALRSQVRAILRAFDAAHGSAAFASGAVGVALVEPLSAQERRVLRLLVAGRTNPEIARELVVSVNTVKGHVKSLYRKLDVRSRLEATEAARLLPRD